MRGDWCLTRAGEENFKNEEEVVNVEKRTRKTRPEVSLYLNSMKSLATLERAASGI